MRVVLGGSISLLFVVLVAFLSIVVFVGYSQEILLTAFETTKTTTTTTTIITLKKTSQEDPITTRITNNSSIDNNNNNTFNKNKNLLFFIHFHKAGGTTMIRFMRKQLQLQSIGKSTCQPPILPSGKDLHVRPNNPNGLIVHSSSKHHRAGQPEFWNSLKNDCNVDFISFEYNFVTPLQFQNIIISDNTSNIQVWTVLRDPWDRFRSTYERELFLACGKNKDKEQTLEDCISQNSLESWMTKGNLARQFPGNSWWGGILYPNYYVRMLNGINDHKKHVDITEYHLEQAKSVLNQLDLVLVLEDVSSANNSNALNKMTSFFNTTNIQLQKATNNGLKNWTIYYESIIQKTNRQKEQFEQENGWDRQLYTYVKNELL